jgi:predicted alpha-1,2-mannosidase
MFAATCGSFHSAALAQANDPFVLVDPFIGTGGGTSHGAVDMIDTFPGASAPFGMVQWSPDTITMPPGGGYFYHDDEITGFSLTHLSGAGCNVFGDFGVLPTVGSIKDPAEATQSFDHPKERALPGFYSVRLSQGIGVSLTAAPRAGLGAFQFPATTQANLLINVSSDQAGVSDAHAWIAGPAEIDGYARSGGFCGMPNSFTVYFAMKFDRPFTSYGAWSGHGLEAAADKTAGTHAGEWVTFDTTHDDTVKAKAAVSYVSVDGARKNLRTLSTWDVNGVSARTAASWRTLLDRVKVDGGTVDDRRMLYSLLYHALLTPTLYSDADGSYLGFDNRVHRDAPGHDEYANFSGWDIYRTQIPLVSLIVPHRVSDMMTSLVHVAQQGGWLPRWPVANGYTGVMAGDSSDPIIAGAYAFGARDFDTAAALRAMLKNATDTTSPPGQGWYYPRPGLQEYMKHGYVLNTHSDSVSPVPNGASETLEYTIDDFSIAQFARSLGRNDVYQQFMERSQNWTKLFDTSIGQIAPRDLEGAFLQSPITESGQSGFQEGNGAQYTWMIPQGMGSLVDGLGGARKSVARLDTFFSKLNAGSGEPYAWFGNEPTLGSPWVYLFTGTPYKAEDVIRRVMLQLYAPTPDGIPGNDDLGTMSSWWLWNAIGLYPLDPGVPVLLLGAPLFPHVELHSPTGRTIVINARGASDSSPYVESLRVNGTASQRAWVCLPASGILRLDYTLGASPNLAFGASQSDAPPNYAIAPVQFPPSTTATLAMQTGTVAVEPGQRAALTFSARVPASSAPVAVQWNAQLPAGLRMSPDAARTVGSASGDAPVVAQVEVDASTEPGLYDVQIHGRAENGAVLAHVTGVVRVERNGVMPSLLYGANFSDDTIVPIDPRTFAYGSPIAVGRKPGDLAISADGARVYTANQMSNDVSVVDARAGRAVAAVKVGEIPAGIRLAPNGKTLWVTNYGDGTVQSIDVATLHAGAPVAVGRHPEQLAIAPDGSRLYVALQGENLLAVVDTKTMSVLGRIPVGKHPVGVAIAPDGKRVFVSSDVSNDVTVVDTSALRAEARVPVGAAPQGLSVSPNGALLYVADSGFDEVTPIDLHALRAEPPIQAGGGPFSVAFDRTGRYAFTADSGDGDSAVIDVSRAAVIARVPLGSFPIAIAAP